MGIRAPKISRKPESNRITVTTLIANWRIRRWVGITLPQVGRSGVRVRVSAQLIYLIEKDLDSRWTKKIVPGGPPLTHGNWEDKGELIWQIFTMWKELKELL